MLTKKTQPLPSPDDRDYPSGIIDRQRDTLPFPPEFPEAPSLDAQLAGDFFHLVRPRPEVPRELRGIDADRPRLPVIHNAFFVPGKVPSLNELLDAKGGTQDKKKLLILRHLPTKGKRVPQWVHAYNDIKQSWKRRTIAAIGTPFVRIQASYFGYVVVEQDRRRDPSNICSSAIKFIEDGIVEAGVMRDDGWDNVLGIRVHWIHRAQREPGIYVVMSDVRLDEEQLEREYEDAHFMRAV